MQLWRGQKIGGQPLVSIKSVRCAKHFLVLAGAEHMRALDNKAHLAEFLQQAVLDILVVQPLVCGRHSRQVADFILQ